MASAFVLRGVNFAAWIVSLGAVAGLTSVLLVLLLGQSRIFYAISRDGLLPAAFSKIHPRFHTPYIPTILTAFVVGVTAAFLPIEEIAELTNIGTLFAFVLVCISVWILRRVDPGLHRPFRTPLVPLVPILGVIFCAFLMASLPGVTWLRFFIWMMVGFVVYFAYGRFHSRMESDPSDRVRMSAD